MYKIIGGDGKEYGPVSADELRRWITEGRANAQTKVQPEGGTEWVTLAACPDFADALSPNASVPGSPPPLGTSSVPIKTSGLAITSLVLGICGLFTCGVASLVGLVLGLVALSQIKKSQGVLGGRGIALAGTIVSACFFLILPVYLAMFLPALANAKSKAQTINCVNNMKQLCLGVRMYIADSKDRFPASTNWCDAIQSYVGNARVFQCAAANGGQRGHYGFNARLSAAEERAVNPSTVMLFEVEDGWNVSGGRERMLKKPRHNRLFVVGLADGSVQQVSEAQLGTLRWDP